MKGLVIILLDPRCDDSQSCFLCYKTFQSDRPHVQFNIIIT